jgi:hypothetical protein
MKKITSTILISTMLFSMVGCSTKESDENVATETVTDITQQEQTEEAKTQQIENITKSGEVVCEGGNPLMFELACDDGKYYGFVVDEDNTELIWEDRSAFSVWEKTSAEYDDWSVFGCDMYVNVVFGDETESADKYLDDEVEGWYFAKSITVTKVGEGYFAVSAKPVIYLYPETTIDVSVSIDYDGILTCTYPQYENGWNVTAQPDGTLIDASGQTYNYLYWEGITSTEYDFSQGFCVKGSDTAAFLETSLAELGLNRKEANEFIVYWLPLMESNAYNLISFQTDAYTNSAKLTITPKPDTLLRIFMAWKPLTEEVEIEPQNLTSCERSGFTVVEWGGTQTK